MDTADASSVEDEKLLAAIHSMMHEVNGRMESEYTAAMQDAAMDQLRADVWADFQKQLVDNWNTLVRTRGYVLLKRVPYIPGADHLAVYAYTDLGNVVIAGSAPFTVDDDPGSAAYFSQERHTLVSGALTYADCPAGRQPIDLSELAPDADSTSITDVLELEDLSSTAQQQHQQRQAPWVSQAHIKFHTEVSGEKRKYGVLEYDSYDSDAPRWMVDLASSTADNRRKSYNHFVTTVANVLGATAVEHTGLFILRANWLEKPFGDTVPERAQRYQWIHPIVGKPDVLRNRFALIERSHDKYREVSHNLTIDRANVVGPIDHFLSLVGGQPFALRQQWVPKNGDDVPSSLITLAPNKPLAIRTDDDGAYIYFETPRSTLPVCYDGRVGEKIVHEIGDTTYTAITQLPMANPETGDRLVLMTDTPDAEDEHNLVKEGGIHVVLVHIKAAGEPLIANLVGIIRDIAGNPLSRHVLESVQQSIRDDRLPEESIQYLKQMLERSQLLSSHATLPRKFTDAVKKELAAGTSLPQAEDKPFVLRPLTDRERARYKPSTTYTCNLGADGGWWIGGPATTLTDATIVGVRYIERYMLRLPPRSPQPRRASVP